MRGFLQPALKNVASETQKAFAELSRGRRVKLAVAANTNLVKASQWSRGDGVPGSFVRVKILTGDSKEVAGWVGVESGLTDDPAEVLLGDEFERMTSEQRAAAVERYDVFARTTPTQ